MKKVENIKSLILTCGCGIWLLYLFTISNYIKIIKSRDGFGSWEKNKYIF